MIPLNLSLHDTLPPGASKITNAIYIGPVAIYHDPKGNQFVFSKDNDWFLCVNKNGPEAFFLKILVDLDNWSIRKIASAPSRKALFRDDNDHLILLLRVLKTKKLNEIFSTSKNAERSSVREVFRGYKVADNDKSRFALLASLLLDKNVYRTFSSTSKFKSERFPYEMFLRVHERYIAQHAD